ncbi:MAG TPA: hypothetical protein VFX56_11470 [Nitrospira sp.]|nr:hypothetical protein [Nitrospira sp.]
MVSRRPELEKDNPIATQPYVGPRRRRAQASAVSMEESAGMGAMKDALQAMMDAASRVVKSLPKTKGTANDLSALRDAIAQAKQVLSATGHAT